MKITEIQVFQVDLPYVDGTYLLSGGRKYDNFDATIVRVVTDAGIDGFGESTPFGATYVAAHGYGVRAGIQEIAPHLIGMDPRHSDRIYDQMDAALVGHPHAKTALDVACWDVFGKAMNMPVCDLLGGSTQQAMSLISSIHSGDPDSMRRRVAYFRSLGYQGHSFKVGDNPQIDAARIRACLADAEPGEYFLCDANGGFSVETALRTLRLIPSDADIVLEAPCTTWREHMSLRRRTNIPMVWDELATSDVSIGQLIAEDGAEGIGLKISKNGGLTSCRRQRDICIAAGYTMSVQDTVGSDIAFAAIVHLAQTIPHKWLRCVLDTRAMVSITTADGDFPINKGKIMAPKTPGLGITPKMEVLGKPVAVYK